MQIVGGGEVRGVEAHEQPAALQHVARLGAVHQLELPHQLHVQLVPQRHVHPSLRAV